MGPYNSGVGLKTLPLYQAAGLVSVKLLAAKGAEANGFESTALRAAVLATRGWSGWTGTVLFDASTGNRQPAPVTVNAVDAQGAFHVDDSWARATGFTF